MGVLTGFFPFHFFFLFWSHKLPRGPSDRALYQVFRDAQPRYSRAAAEGSGFERGKYRKAKALLYSINLV